jgi:hypothetical protein
VDPERSMDKASFTFVPRRRDAAGAYRENAGPLWAGADGRLGIRVERVQNLYAFVKAPCELIVYEVSGAGADWTAEAELARFDVKIRREGTKFFFTVNRRKDTPTYANALPAPTEPWEHWYQEPWKLKPRRVFRGPWAMTPVKFTSGYKPGWLPPWQPPHFVLDFCTAEGVFDKATTVVIPSTCRQESARTGSGSLRAIEHFYTVAFEIWVGGKPKAEEDAAGEDAEKKTADFRSSALPIHCHNILAHNLRVAAEGMLLAHDEMIYHRLKATVVVPGHRPASSLLISGGSFSDAVGTHYGTDWVKNVFVKKGSQQARFVYKHAEKHRLQYMSCMEYPLQVGQIGFARTFGAPKVVAGARPVNAMWKRYRGSMPKSNATFVPICRELVRAGWISVYFNPDTRNPGMEGKWDKRYHLTTARLACREPGTYKGIPVHDRLVDYRLTSTPTGRRVLTVAQSLRLSTQLTQLANVEFAFIITADAKSAHCAMLIWGKVHEVHYGQGPDESFLFDNGRKLEEWPWGSGLFVTPRGQWKVSR